MCGAVEQEARLRATVDQVVAGLLGANIAHKIFETDHRAAEPYWILATPGAFEKRLVAIAVLGHPEQVGVWSYTLLSQRRVDESSMEPYFREFVRHDLGLVAINPNFFAPDIEGDAFFYQLDRAVSRIDPGTKCGLIGFSMGGRIVIEFLAQHPDILGRMAGLVLIDPTLPNRLKLDSIRNLLDRDTLLVASDGQPDSPGKIASALLDIPAVRIPGIHGEMPNKALRRIVEFYKERIGGAAGDPEGENK